MVLPVIGGVGPPLVGLSEIDLESYDPFDQIETDDDFLILSMAGVVIAGLISSKLQAINLDFQSAFLLPDFPPPKPS